MGNRAQSEAPESPGVFPSRLFFISLSFVFLCRELQLTPGHASGRLERSGDTVTRSQSLAPDDPQQILAAAPPAMTVA